MVWQHKSSFGIALISSRKHFLYAALLLFSTLSLVVSQARAQGSIQGQVQRQGQGIAQHRIMLIRLGPNNQVERFPGQTDAQGGFLFEDLDTSPTFTYFVGIRYNDQLYRSEPITLQSTPRRTDIVVMVTDQAASQEASPSSTAGTPYITNHLVVAGWRDSRIEVREVLQVVHPGASPYTGQAPGPGAPRISLRLSLPQGYQNLRDMQGLEKDHVIVHAQGLYYTAPLPPGEHRVIYTYTMPWNSRVITLLLERSLPTQTLDLLAAEEHLVSSSDLEFLGPVPLAEQVFAHFRGTNLEASSRAWLQLTRRQEHYGAAIQVGTYGVIIGIALLGIVIPLLPRRYS